MTALVEQIESLIKPTVEAMGFELVQVRYMEGNKSRLLQVMAERPDGSMSLDDCGTLSSQISAVLDVEDIIPSAYRLEISSPGIDRPLTRARDFETYKGHLAKLELNLPVNGRRRFTGTLNGMENDVVSLTVDNQPVALPYRDIQSAKLVLTDALIKAHQKHAS